MGFLDRYSWLRSSPQAASALQVAGLLMIVTSGFWAATQRHLGRIMAYGSIAESGFAILALSLNSRVGVPILFLLLPARALSLAVWSLALTIFKNNNETLRFGAVRGLSRISLGAALWLGIGIVGLLISSFRSLAVLSMADEYQGWEVRENWLQGIMLGLGVIGLFILGLFPQLIQYFLSDLPAMFERLGR
jgi:formate hydrogenlyase subunit 3/multisubunit Na+/H+ antiporter MnhD subunit